jgi:beta-lactamase regulating signal transducer with metallopeptidase domain
MERAILEYLANALWQLPVLAAGAWVLLWLMKPGPQTQYRVWLTVLGLAVILPAWGIRGAEIVPVSGAAFDQFATTRLVQRSSAVVVVDETAPLPAMSEPVEVSTDTTKGMWRLPFRVQRVHLSATAVHWVMGVYASSVLLGLVRVIRAWRGARRLVETSRQVALCSTAEAVLEDFGRNFDVSLPEVRECAAVTSPMVVGAASPVVLLPEGFADHAEDEVRAALLHELAHVKRRDYLTNGVCQVAVLPVLWHPVAFGVQQRIRRTREMVCDQMAAREMRSELGYARCLLTMARRMLGGGLAERPEFVGLFSNNVLEERVMRLMETKSVLTVRARLVRLASGATAMATATLMATSFHVVPTMAAASSTMVQTAVLRATVLGSADATVGAPVCVHRLAKPVVAPSAPVMAKPVVAPMALAMPGAAPHVTPAVQSVPATAPTAPAPATAPSMPENAPEAPAALSATPQVAPVAPTAPIASDDEKKLKGPKNKTHIYRMMTGPNGEAMVIADGEMRPMTPEERQRIEKAMADSAEGMRKALDAVDSPEFRGQMAEVQKAMEKLKSRAYFDSEEFNKQMDAARQEMAKQSALNSAEMQERLAQVQSMMRDLKMPKMDQFCCKCKDGAEKDKQKTEKEKVK